MIPLNLQIRNFLSYGALQKIDFEPYNLICLSGRNGHGKSALLDAITWAVWGQARKVSNTSKADEGLLRLGQSQMFVAMDFKVNGQKYRVRREFTLLNQKATTNLDFAVWENSSQQYKSLTDKTIRATQEKIEQVIGLTFDSFINSAFLKQGQSNEFSKKSPKERKEILATILGLSKYEAMRKLAAEKSKDGLGSKQHLVNLQQHLQIEIKNKDLVCSQLTEIESKIFNSLENNIKTNFLILSQEKKSLEVEKDKIKIAKFKLYQINSTTIIDSSHLNNIFTIWRKSNIKLKSGNRFNAQKERESLEIEANLLKNSGQEKIALQENYFKQKELAQNFLQTLNQQKSLELEALRIELKSIEFELSGQSNKSKELETTFNKKSFELLEQNKKFSELKKQLENLSGLEKSLSYEETVFEKRKNFYQKYVVVGNKISTEYKNCDQKINLVGNTDNPCCPLCKQDLRLDRKSSLTAQFSKEKSLYNHQINRISKLLKNLKEIILNQHANIEKIKKEIEKLKASKALFEQTEVNINKLNSELAELSNIIKDNQNNITNLKHNFDQKNLKLADLNVSSNLENNSEYKTILENLRNLEQQIKLADLKIIKYQKILENLENIKSLQNSSNNIEQEILLQQNRKREIQELIKKLKKLKQEKKSLESELSTEENIIISENKIIEQENLLNLNLTNLFKEKETLLHQKGALEQQQKNILKLEAEHQANEQKLKDIVANIEQYQALSIALSKDGIQALLIEDAIPEIEQEANNLLSKLTDNQAQLFIESLRDLKSGGTKETLDIKISDPSGIRPYELFSGGEAFRIDFALRIAISKLLARRAGTALETLIIDEGFGSQDEEGLSNIMDTIHKIQEDFAKVIIVSHLPSMKDQFPVHFIIQKGPDGSGVKVMENG